MNTGADIGARILDAHIEADGTVRSVRTRTGLLPEPDVPSSSVASTREYAADENHRGSTGPVVERHAPKIWALWLGGRSTEIELCHALCTSPERDTPFHDMTSGTLGLVEALLESERAPASG